MGKPSDSVGTVTYWELSPETTGDASRVARGQHDHAVARRLLRAGWIPHEELPELVWLWEQERAPAPDVPFTVDGVRLVSPTVRAILDAWLQPRDVVQWLPAVILDGIRGRREAWVLHLPAHEDLLDVDATTWGPRHSPIRYVYSRAKLSGHGLTAFSNPAQVVHTRAAGAIEVPSLITSQAVVITEDAAHALRAAGVTGARITPAPVI